MSRECGPVQGDWWRAAAYFYLLEVIPSAKERGALWSVMAPQLVGGGYAAVAPLLRQSPSAIAEGHAAAFERLRHLALTHPSFAVLERGRSPYPERLAAVADAPLFLTVEGDSDLLARPSVAVVGSRQPTADGMQRARYLAYQLARRNVVVASGLARGIDGAAHAGVLHAGGPTIAVLGTPVDRTYPREHEALQRRIAATGAVVSQFPPGLPVQRHFFPLRNAVMSGLTVATVVVEASETSGALIQARACLRQGRLLFIPRSATRRPDLRWPMQLAEQGARVFDTVDEVLDAIDLRDARSTAMVRLGGHVH